MKTTRVLLLLLLLLMCLFLTHSISAQNFGIRGGLLYCDVELKTPGVTFNTLHPEPDIGFYLGIAYKIPINKFIEIKTELSFIEKQSKQYNGDPELTVFNYDYLALPLILKLKIYKELSIELGAAPSIWVGSNFFESGIEKFDLGLVGGISYLAMEKIELTVRYDYSLKSFSTLNLTDDAGNSAGKFEYYHRNIQLGVGYYF